MGNDRKVIIKQKGRLIKQLLVTRSSFFFIKTLALRQLFFPPYFLLATFF